jgi:hypothetical protein
VWRDSDHLVSGFMAIKDRKERETAVSDYIDGGKHAKTQFAKPEGARLVEGLAKLRTWSFRLMADVCANHADIIRDIVAKKAAGATGEALQQAFTRFVKGQYGDGNLLFAFVQTTCKWLGPTQRSADYLILKSAPAPGLM